MPDRATCGTHYKFRAIWFLAARQIQSETTTNTARTLPHPIARRVRQRLLVFVDPSPIAVRTENLIRVDDVMESPKLAE
jgi:hypothetical protein